MGGPRVVLAVLLALVGGVVLSSVPAGAAGSDPRSEADWILSAQLPSGAIATHADQTFVSPYLAAYAAVGLSDATTMTRDPRYAEAAWRSLEWYGSVMDANGYVTDYQISNGNLVSTGSADSTDVYAGMFLVALDAAYRAAPNMSRLQRDRTEGTGRSKRRALDTTRRRAHRCQAVVHGRVSHEPGRGPRGPRRGDSPRVHAGQSFTRTFCP